MSDILIAVLNRSTVPLGSNRSAVLAASRSYRNTRCAPASAAAANAAAPRATMAQERSVIVPPVTLKTAGRPFRFSSPAMHCPRYKATATP